MLTTTESPIDLGLIKFGKPKSFSFQVRNCGNFPIQITKLWVGCSSCTTAVVRKAMLAEGECTTVDVVFTPGTLGAQRKYVQVQWNGLKVLKLEFTATSYV